MKKLYIMVNVDWFFLSHRKEIAISALNAGYDVTVVAKDTGKSNEIRDLGLKFINLPMNSVGKNPFEDLYTLGFLHRLYKRKKPDIVHHVGLKAILWGSLAAKRANIPKVVNAISGLGVFFAENNKSLLSKVIVGLLRYSHKRKNIYTIFQNTEDRNLFLNAKIVTNTNVVMIKGSGVDLSEFSYTPESNNSILKVVLMARMLEDKGIFVLIDAAETLRKRYQGKVQFLLCGRIDSNPNAIRKEELQKRCDGSYIQWLGHCTNVKEILQDCHVVTLPSYYKEGLPKSLIEATAIGRPIVTTDSIGCREAVVEGYNGYLIPIKNSEALAEKLKILFDDKDLRIEMGKHSRVYAEQNFSIETVIEKHMEVYAR